MQTRHNHKGYIGVSADRSEDPAFAVNTLLSGRSIRFAWQLAVVKKKSLLAAGRLFPQQKSGWPSRDLPGRGRLRTYR